MDLFVSQSSNAPERGRIKCYRALYGREESGNGRVITTFEGGGFKEGRQRRSGKRGTRARTLSWHVTPQDNPFASGITWGPSYVSLRIQISVIVPFF